MLPLWRVSELDQFRKLAHSQIHLNRLVLIETQRERLQYTENESFLVGVIDSLVADLLILKHRVVVRELSRIYVTDSVTDSVTKSVTESVTKSDVRVRVHEIIIIGIAK
jgi:hypothetical protein